MLGPTAPLGVAALEASRDPLPDAPLVAVGGGVGAAGPGAAAAPAGFGPGLAVVRHSRAGATVRRGRCGPGVEAAGREVAAGLGVAGATPTRAELAGAGDGEVQR